MYNQKYIQKLQIVTDAHTKILQSVSKNVVFNYKLIFIGKVERKCFANIIHTHKFPQVVELLQTKNKHTKIIHKF